MPFGQGTELLELLDERTRLGQELGQLKGRMTQLETKIVGLTAGPLKNAYVRVGTPSGTVKFALDNHMFKAVVDKSVKWDSEALEDIARQLPPQDVKELFKVTYTMPEAVFKSIIEPTLKARLTVARTVKYSEPKISLADGE